MESKYMGLTTVDQFISEMGYVATQMLIKLINGDPLELQTYKMQTQLVVRTSCQALTANAIKQPERHRHTVRKSPNDV
jgi:DNA-binding LacI/PurR family transcriptional regulator